MSDKSPLPPWLSMFAGGKDEDSGKPAAGGTSGPAAQPTRGNAWLADLVSSFAPAAGAVTDQPVDLEQAADPWAHGKAPKAKGVPSAPNGAGKDAGKAPWLKGDWWKSGGYAETDGKHSHGGKLTYDNKKLSLEGKHAATGAGAKVKLGKDSYGGELSSTMDHADGGTSKAAFGGSYDKGYWGAAGSYSRQGGGADYDKVDNRTDRSGSGSLSVNDGGDVKAKGAYTQGKGKHARGGSATIDSAKGTYGGTATYGNVTAGGGVMQDGFFVQGGYKNVGGGAMYQSNDERTTVGANIGLGKRFAAGAYGTWTDDSYYAGGNVAAYGIGVGGGYGETTDRTTHDQFAAGQDDAFTGAPYAQSSIENASRWDLNGQAVVVEGGGGQQEQEWSRFKQVLPEGHESWTDDQREKWQTSMALRAKAVDSPDKLDLSTLPAGAGHEWAQRTGSYWNAKGDGKVPVLGGLELGGGQDWSKGSHLEVTNLGDAYQFSEGRQDSDAWNIGGSFDLGFIASVNGDYAESLASTSEDQYLVGGDHTALGQSRLDSGFVPGAQQGTGNFWADLPLQQVEWADTAERELQAQLAEVKNPWQRAPLLAQLETVRGQRDQAIAMANRSKLDRTGVGEPLTDGAVMRQKVDTERQQESGSFGGSFLWWGDETSYEHTRSETVRDRMDEGGNKQRTQAVSTSYKEDEAWTEKLDLATSSERTGPAMAFTTRQNVDDSDHLAKAHNFGGAVPSGAAAMGGQDEQLKTQVALSHEDTAKLAETMNSPELRGRTWGGMQGRLRSLLDGDADMDIQAMMMRASATVYRDQLLAVDGPEAFSALSPQVQQVFVKAVHHATVSSDTGNVFDNIAAIETIPDARVRQQLYTDILEDAGERGASDILDGDLGSEFLSFAKRFQGTSGQDALAGKVSTSLTTPLVETAVQGDAKSQGLQLKTLGNMWGMGTDLLRGAHARGGPKEVEAVIRAAGWDVEKVWAQMTDDTADKQWMLSMLQGTVMGAQLETLVHGVQAMDFTSFGDLAAQRQRLVDEARAVTTPNQAAATDPAGRRTQAVRRNLKLSGGGQGVAASFSEAAQEGRGAVDRLVEDVGVDVLADYVDRADTFAGVRLVTHLVATPKGREVLAARERKRKAKAAAAQAKVDETLRKLGWAD